MSAIISPCGLYRYRLERGNPTNTRAVAFIMVNPSTADGTHDDATIRKVMGFARGYGCGRIIVGNKFAFRATDIRDLRIPSDPIGPDNDRHLEQIMGDADLHIVAWGRLSKLPPQLRSRWLNVAALADRVGCRLLCLGTAQDGHPLHPLTLSYERPLIEWRWP